MVRAFTRAVSPNIADCALTHLDRAPIDASRAIAQHAAYEAALSAAGATITRLAELPAHPDGVFVEDTAILLGDAAIVTRPGAPSRAAEADATAAGLAGHFGVQRMAAGRLDGGDVLRVGRTLFVGLSSRTDAAGAAELEALAGPLGYAVVPVELDACLHLKTAVSFAGQDAAGKPMVLLNPDWIASDLFAEFNTIAVDPAEPFAANVLSVGRRVIMPSGSPRTADRLRARGFSVVEVDVSELQKAEAGVTCMSLVAED